MKQQAELVWRLRSVYNRTEVVEVLRQLSEDGFIRRRLSRNKQILELGLVAVREEEEREEYWFFGRSEMVPDSNSDIILTSFHCPNPQICRLETEHEIDHPFA